VMMGSPKMTTRLTRLLLLSWSGFLWNRFGRWNG
jgi:hypothetical protein